MVPVVPLHWRHHRSRRDGPDRRRTHARHAVDARQATTPTPTAAPQPLPGPAPPLPDHRRAAGIPGVPRPFHHRQGPRGAGAGARARRPVSAEGGADEAAVPLHRHDARRTAPRRSSPTTARSSWGTSSRRLVVRPQRAPPGTTYRRRCPACTSRGYERHIHRMYSIHASHSARGPAVPGPRARRALEAGRAGTKLRQVDQTPTAPAASSTAACGRCQPLSDTGPAVRGRYGEHGQYMWRYPRARSPTTPSPRTRRARPASEVIDWTLPAVSIGDGPTPACGRWPGRHAPVRAGFNAFPQAPDGPRRRTGREACGTVEQAASRQ